MRLFLLLGVAAVLAACAGAMASPSAAVVSQIPPRPVVGAGTINVPRLKVRAAPRATARVIATLSEFRPQDYRARYVLALGTKRDLTGRKIAWYRISVPGRPNGRVGWVRALDVSIRRLPWQVVVLRESKLIQVWKGSELVYQSKVAVGAPGTETPTGLFYVTVRFRPVKQAFLGAFAFETSAYSKLSEWPGGGVVGLHGTRQPWLLGRAVSHGCVRLSNETASFLRDRLPLGTPIRIVRA